MKSSQLLAGLVLAIVPVATCAAQDSTILASSIEWQSGFGGNRSNPHVVYRLLTQGFFRAPHSSDFDRIVTEWLHRHPRATLVTVDVIQPESTNDPESQDRGVWIVDGPENLNLELVRAGACPGWTMTLFPSDAPRVPRAVYDAFLVQLRHADSLAQTENRGVYAAPSR